MIKIKKGNHFLLENILSEEFTLVNDDGLPNY